MREAKPLCEAILFAARAANATPSTVSGGFACEPSGAQARDRLTARDEMTAARAVFDEKCSLEGELRDRIGAVANHFARRPPPTDRGASGFNEAKKLCRRLRSRESRLGLNQADVRVLLRAETIISCAPTPRTQQVRTAREAFWSFTPDATMAICVPWRRHLFLDHEVSVKIFKHGLERASVVIRRAAGLPTASRSGQTRAMKAVMRAARPVHGDMSKNDPEAATFTLLL